MTISLSILLLTAGYLIDSYFSEPNLLSKCAGVVSVLGLILTIKHSYLFHISSTRNLISRDYSESQCGPSIEEVAQNTPYMNQLYSKATDEGLGLIVILVGTLISSFGSYIPLISMCLAT